MIAYFKCVCKSKDKILVKRLKQQGVKIRVTDWNLEYRQEAKKYGLKLPFIVEDGKARPING